jgi:trimeric autotransporter adhesin
MKNQYRKLKTILFGCVFLALSPLARAVSPAPDGGYPGGNTAEGQSSLLSLTSGNYNTAVGIFSLLSLTDGSFNTGVGAGTLLLNTGDSNTATGAGALLSNSTGVANTANGTFALFNNTQGSDNVAIGDSALFSNTATGNTAAGSSALLNNTTGGTLGNVQGFDVGPNVAVGWEALESNTVASANTAVGYQALQSFTTGPAGFEQLGLCTAVGFQALANDTGFGFGNSALGYQALKSNTTGGGNTAIGFGALRDNTESGNTAIGSAALFTNTTGFNNTAVGVSALASNNGIQNTAVGNSALASNTSGFENTASGEAALIQNTMGIGNTAVGWNTLANNTTGNGNVALGHEAGTQATGDGNVYIGATVHGVAGESNACYIRSIFGQTSASGVQVFINSDNKLGTVTSSKRFKEDIKRMDKASEAILALQPVTFRYKKDFDPSGTPQFGLVAEEVERVNPDLVVHDKDGKPYSVRYDQVNAMLLNEFLKEHRKVEEQDCRIQQQETTIARQRNDFEATIAELKKEMETVVVRLKDQDAKIQRVSDRVEMTKPAARVVLNNP